MIVAVLTKIMTHLHQRISIHAGQVLEWARDHFTRKIYSVFTTLVELIKLVSH